MEALIDQLQSGDYTSAYQTDLSGWVTHLFFAHLKSLELLQQFPHILLLDCTYKTNKFKLPLLSIVGSDAANDNFHAAFCFLPGEEEDHYIWALGHLNQILPEACIPGMM